MYNSILIEGPQSTIDSISALIKGEDSFLNDLFPPVQNHIVWKKANWGVSKAEDVYLNEHHSSAGGTPASIMIGFEADGQALKWVEQLALSYPSILVELEIDGDINKGDKPIFRFSDGKRKSNQLSLF